VPPHVRLLLEPLFPTTETCPLFGTYLRFPPFSLRATRLSPPYFHGSVPCFLNGVCGGDCPRSRIFFLANCIFLVDGFQRSLFSQQRAPPVIPFIALSFTFVEPPSFTVFLILEYWPPGGTSEAGSHPDGSGSLRDHRDFFRVLRVVADVPLYAWVPGSCVRVFLFFPLRPP